MDRGARRWILYGFLSTFGKFRFALRAAASRPDGAEGAVGAVGCKSSDVTLLAGWLVIFILTVRVVFLTKRHGFGPVPAGVRGRVGSGPAPRSAGGHPARGRAWSSVSSGVPSDRSRSVAFSRPRFLERCPAAPRALGFEPRGAWGSPAVHPNASRCRATRPRCPSADPTETFGGQSRQPAPAAMAENWKNCFEEELICPICLHVFVEPVQLPCKHNFCRGCIGEAWAKETGLVRCPECNQAYNQKPNLEKNLKLTNIVEKFNSLNLEKPPSVLHCVFCRRGPPLPAQKICLRCEAPCCQSHVQTHLQQPSTARGHLLVEADDVRAWSCPQHNAYRLYHCEAEQVAVCQFCCYYSGAHQGHSVCDVEIRRNEIRVSPVSAEAREMLW